MTIADEFAARIRSLDFEQAKSQALAAAAAQLDQQVRAGLAAAPDADHQFPWKRTGALQASIGCSVQGDRAVVGSTDPVAVIQEMGSRYVPPRPFLATCAEDCSEGLAEVISQVMSDMLR